LKVVLLLGAGATLADVATHPRKDRPPLDRGFFREARLTHPVQVNQIRRYLQSTYDRDILKPENDRLEAVMAQVYTDLFNPLLEDEALRTFRGLVNLFTRRLAATTNGIRPTNKRLVYRVIAAYLAKGVRPEDMTIVTFNQDIQVEKILHLMSTVRRWHHIAETVFAFPDLYALRRHPGRAVTAPSPTGGVELFESGGDAERCIRLLKLHGSLNWYSSHSSRQPSRTAMFSPKRVIHITRRQTIDPGMTLQSTQRQMYTLPVIVPPVTHKSAVIHPNLLELWALSETSLREADELVVFGYSCPVLDVESSNQLRRSQIQRARPAAIAVVDPDGSVAHRYISLLEATRLHYYANGQAFLSRPS
jgi:hypothetical protein